MPEGVNQVVRSIQGDVFRGEGGFQLALGGKREHIGGDANAAVWREVFGEAVDVGFAEAEFLQDDAAARELLRRLLPVAAVRPQFGAVGGDDEGGDGAVEAGEPAAGLPVFGNVFGEVRVGGRRNPGVEVGGFHRGAQRGDAFGGGVEVHAGFLW